MTLIVKFVERLERLFFGHRATILALLAVLTVVMAFFASQLKMDAGFDKQLPQDHEYVQTFFRFRGVLVPTAHRAAPAPGISGAHPR
jgi:hypothetical protein